MRFLADQNISPATVEWLCANGHDSVRVSTVLPSNASDAVILAFAARHQYVILTHDLDFGPLIIIGKVPVSLIQLRLSTTKVERVNSTLAIALPGLLSALSEGAIVVLEDARSRIRPLTT